MSVEFPQELSGHSFLKTKREAEALSVETISIKEECSGNKRNNCLKTLASLGDDGPFSRSSLLAQVSHFLWKEIDGGKTRSKRKSIYINYIQRQSLKVPVD